MTLVIIFAAGILFGCGGEQQGTSEQNENGSEKTTTQDTTNKEINIGYVEWDDCVAVTYVMKHVLSDMGYNVNITSVDAGVMWSGVAQGDFDFVMGAWLPKTQADYWKEFKNDVVDLGPNYKGAKIGLVVPEYVNFDSIEQLNEHKDKFNGVITGIEPGAGIMQTTEKAISEYGLDLELKDSSSAAMAASLQRAVNNDKWIVVTGWNPHWKFAKWDLKYLEDPKKIYGGEEHINTLARQGLKEDMPDIYSIADKFYWTSEEIGPIMLKIQSGMSADKAAKEFINKHPDIVKKWTS
ncbi:MAG: glycine betaine ABC transporter substrate-binding protein [Clostridiales bacterium]|nr:glycine betaine ABC transporter substrate-binding protein [Clostridiales bacterium]MCF8021644.1 glycine betaine ABC transporter substrate-binding protein [Clostridiales bacterium]